MQSKQSNPERLMVYGNRASLVGILTYATRRQQAEGPDRPCVIILNAGIIRKAGPGRMTVTLARGIAASGFDVFRFDFAGVGDSPIRSDGQSLVDGVLLDVQETMDHLERVLGYRQFIVVGLCSGADNGMRAAEKDERIVGVGMFDPTIERSKRWYWEKLKSKLSSTDYLKSLVLFQHPTLKKLLGTTNSDKRIDDVSDEKPELYQVAYADRADISRCLETLISRNVKLFITFTGSWDFIYNYELQIYDVYPRLHFGEQLTLTYRPEADHCFSNSGHRQRLLDDLIAWCGQFG